MTTNNVEQISWKAPQKVTEWQRAQVKSQIWNFWLITAKTSWPLLLVGLCIAYYLGPLAFEEDYAEFFTGFLLLTIFFPPVFTLLIMGQFFLKFFSRKNDEYEINQKGLLCRSYLTAIRVSWRRLERYSFTDHEDLGGIRIFEFTLKPIKYIGDKQERWYKFYFDPNEIDENQIQKIIDLNVPA